MPETAIEAISANIINSRFEDIDKEYITLAKNRVIDVLGCAIGGADAPGNAGFLKMVKKWGGEGQSTILVHGGKVPAHNAAMLNAVMARSFDFEVMSFVCQGRVVPSHTAATTVMTALALAESTGASGKEFLTALIAGDDVPARVSLASDWDFFIGFDAIGTLVPFGTTAIAGRLLGLTKEQLKQAFGIQLNLFAGSIQSIWDGATTFKLNQGTPARDGIFSAELAKEGWIGCEDALLSRFGYYKLYTRGCKDPSILTKDLGKVYYGESNFKAYPSGLPVHTAIDCGLALYHKHGVRAGDIQEVSLYLSKGAMQNYYAKPYAVRAYPLGDALFSFRYGLATALLKGDVQIEDYTEESIRNPAVDALIKIINLVEVAEVSRYATEVRVKLTSGSILSESTSTPKGNPIAHPFSKEEILAKYRHQVAFSKTVSFNNSERLLELVDHLEDLPDLRQIASLAVE
jgi:2-methylcitrate dehydratase PrpD